MNKSILFFFPFLLFSQQGWAWSKNGHRIVARIAQIHLKKKVKRKVNQLLYPSTLTHSGNWADEIKSDKKYDYAKPWHYVNFPFDKTYEESQKNSKGDLLKSLSEMERILKNKKSTRLQKINALKFLIHFVGDLHQPFHVGIKKDRGGTRAEVKWFGKDTNLHRVWDSELIAYTKLSFSEYAQKLNRFSVRERREILKGGYLDWARESREDLKKLYDYKEDELGYKYAYKFLPMMDQKLKSAGLRLANVLNRIFR